MIYRSTPLKWCNQSPAELCMGRKINTNLPQLPNSLVPEWSYLEQYRQADQLYKDRMSQDYNRRHRTTTLPDIADGSPVLVQFGDRRVAGTTVRSADAPRSYMVETAPGGLVRRNRQHIVPLPHSSPPKRLASGPNKRSPIMTRSRSQALQRKGDVET